MSYIPGGRLAAGFDDAGVIRQYVKKTFDGMQERRDEEPGLWKPFAPTDEAGIRNHEAQMQVHVGIASYIVAWTLQGDTTWGTGASNGIETRINQWGDNSQVTLEQIGVYGYVVRQVLAPAGEEQWRAALATSNRIDEALAGLALSDVQQLPEAA